eukprot:799022-Lingulodinium_polyedra.AAC.1
MSPGRGGRSAGKGRKNPKDRFGNVLKCSICQSDEHLRARCPNRQGSSSFTAFELPIAPAGSDAPAPDFS